MLLVHALATLDQDLAYNADGQVMIMYKRVLQQLPMLCLL